MSCASRALAPTFDRRSQCCFDWPPSTGPPRARKTTARCRPRRPGGTSAHPDAHAPSRPVLPRTDHRSKTRLINIPPSAPFRGLCLLEDYAYSNRMQFEPKRRRGRRWPAADHHAGPQQGSVASNIWRARRRRPSTALFMAAQQVLYPEEAGRSNGAAGRRGGPQVRRIRRNTGAHSLVCPLWRSLEAQGFAQRRPPESCQQA
jgi:hypothetical protein